MDPVARQYETYPYPERNPADEAKRLITGSPSHPVEIDHLLYGGRRDWSRPFRALVAGGGTGDGLIMLAQILAGNGVEAEIVYLDMSEASRSIAEARAAARGLTNIDFRTGDLLRAAEYGPFDYIDCCGVLHHLPDPDAGFSALRAALGAGGGIGGMVYAPYGRAGVYEMQDALRALVADDPPKAQVAHAKGLLKSLPPTNGFRRNPFLHDHRAGGDAGLYDLLLHGRDRPYDVTALFEALERADLEFVSFPVPGRYDPCALIADPALRARAAALPYRERAALGERLVGNIKAHVFYAVAKGTTPETARPAPDAVPVPMGVEAEALARTIRKNGVVRGEFDGFKFQRAVPRKAADILAQIDGQRTLAEIRAALGWPGERFDAAFAKLHDPLTAFGLLRFSRLKRFASSR